MGGFEKGDIVRLVHKTGDTSDSGEITAEIIEFEELFIVVRHSDGSQTLIPTDNLYYLKK